MLIPYLYTYIVHFILTYDILLGSLNQPLTFVGAAKDIFKQWFQSLNKAKAGHRETMHLNIFVLIFVFVFLFVWCKQPAERMAHTWTKKIKRNKTGIFPFSYYW